MKQVRLVYIAAPYPLRDRAVALMEQLERAGHVVTSRWLKSPDEISDAYAREDLADVARADYLVAVNPSEWANQGTGGRHVEFGYALALSKRMLLIGDRSNIFHQLYDIALVPSDDEAVKWLSE